MHCWGIEGLLALEMFAAPKPEASRPSKPSERTPTARVNDKVTLWVNAKLRFNLGLLYKLESQGQTQSPNNKDESCDYSSSEKVETSMDFAVRPSVFSPRKSTGPLIVFSWHWSSNFLLLVLNTISELPLSTSIFSCVPLLQILVFYIIRHAFFLPLYCSPSCHKILVAKTVSIEVCIYVGQRSTRSSSTFTSH